MKEKVTSKRNEESTTRNRRIRDKEANENGQRMDRGGTMTK